MEKNEFILYRRFCIVFLVVVLLTGCSGSRAMSEPQDGTLPVQTGVPLTATPTIPVSTNAPGTPHATPSAYFTPTPEAARPTQPPTPTFTPAPIREGCTPLEGHSLHDLREILTNPFNPPPAGKDTGHHGVDFAYYRRGERTSILGVPIHSVLAGQVAGLALNRIPYGNMIIVETTFDAVPAQIIQALGVPENHSLYLLYAHMNTAPLVGLAERVECGQALGEVGNTPKGWSSDPHLHLEVRVGPPGFIFQSMDFYDTGATPEEMDNYRIWRMSGEFKMLDPMLLLETGLME